jgi:homopolymeric O-antigen transport system permease protein
MALYTDLYRYRELFLNLFRRDLSVRYKGSFLGLAWTLLNPLVLMGAYTLVFSLLLRAVSVEYYPLFVLAGLVTWVFFQASLQIASTSLLGQANLVKQVRFPRQLLPLSVVGTNLVAFFAMLAIILPINLVLIPETRSTFWVVAPLLVPLVALVSGLAIIVASLNVRFRDVEHLLAAVFLPWFFLTPIFYSFDQLPGLEGNRWIVDVLHYGNFLAPVVTAIRDPLFFGRLPTAADVLYTFGAAGAALALSAIVFRRVDDQLAAEL